MRLGIEMYRGDDTTAIDARLAMRNDEWGLGLEGALQNGSAR